MEKIVLQATSRDERGKTNRRVRKLGRVPGVVYGHSVPATALSLASRELEKVYAVAGTNKIIQVKVAEGKSTNVLIHDVQHDPRSGAIIHVDLYAVRMDEKVKTEVPLHFVGETPAVYQEGGTLVKNLETLEVEALPAELPENFEVDIAVLTDFEASIHVRDLAVPAGVEVLNEADELVAKVDPPRSDEELAELDEEIKEELPEGVAEEGEAGEGAEGEEGADESKGVAEAKSEGDNAKKDDD